MKFLTVVILIMASLIVGYIFSQYNRGVVRLYSLSGTQGRFFMVPSKEDPKNDDYFFEMNSFGIKSDYISDESPQHSVKQSKTHKIFAYWQKHGSRYLDALLYFKDKDKVHKKWLKIKPNPYDGESDKMVFSVEALPFKRKQFDQMEEPDKIKEIMVSRPELLVLSITR